MTIKCNNCGHGKTLHYRYTSLTTGIIHHGHCYYPGFKAKEYDCTCSEFAFPKLSEGDKNE